MTRAFRRLPLAALAAALLLFAGCGDAPDALPDDTPTTPPPTGPVMQVTHALLGTTDAFPDVKPGDLRPVYDPARAESLAKDLIADLRAGRRTMEEVVERFSSDRDPKTGAANSGDMTRGPGKKPPPGTYVFREGAMVAEFTAAAKQTPVGQVFPDPVKTKFGYHVIRRDR